MNNVPSAVTFKRNQPEPAQPDQIQAACPTPMANQTLSSRESQPVRNGITINSLTGPKCLIDDIEDFETTTVYMVKMALTRCLDLPDWVQSKHIQLYFKGSMLPEDEVCLSDVEIKNGETLRYVVMIP